MDSQEEIDSSEDEFDLAMFRSIDDILNENRESSDKDDSIEDSDIVGNTRSRKIRIIESESEESEDSDITDNEDISSSC